MQLVYWTVIYKHRHGTDAWPVFSHQCDDPDRGPTMDEVIDVIGDLYEPDREDEWIYTSDQQTVEIPDSPEVDFWKKTAIDLFNKADPSIVDEDLSSKQIERLNEALSEKTEK